MFWSHEKQASAEAIGRHLTEELRLRLRVAADFATLGAYELSEPEDLPPRRATREEAPQRVFLFAKVPPACPHSAPVERACTERKGPQRRTRRRRRGGAVAMPAQPCLCAGERAPVA